MSENPSTQRATLRRIARQAMADRGLQPDFAPAALAELETIAAAPHPPDRSLRDLRSLPWCSIDNDDSMDLDQLSVAVSAAGAPTRVLVAIADVDALV
ncbi:MAG TPA: hypothetical protein VLW17_05775, partial [Thermoanaerobaculaceae bacterium]|nr:hypothetical protein [Thermoanaerobaculaceae bacterium]